MKIVWMAGLAAIAMSGAAWSQSTIYKHVDESGRITYTNKPMKGATVMELDPIMVIPATPVPAQRVAEPKAATLEKAAFTPDKSDAKSDVKPIAAIVTPLPRTTLASIQPQVQKSRDEERRRILEEELAREESSLTGVRTSLVQEQQNPELVAAVRNLQQAVDPSPSALVQY